jgi:hypothetical protein
LCVSDAFYLNLSNTKTKPQSVTRRFSMSTADLPVISERAQYAQLSNTEYTCRHKKNLYCPFQSAGTNIVDDFMFLSL